MNKIQEIIRLSSQTTYSIRNIARATKTSRPVVSRYLEKFKKTGLLYEDILHLKDDELEKILLEKAAVKTERYTHLSDKYEYLLAELKKPGVTIQKLWEEYIQHNPSGFQRSQFCYYFQQWRKAGDLTMHIQHKAADKMFVDFAGKKLHLTDKETGKQIPVETFVAILPASQYTFMCVTENQKTESWIKGTEEALWYFGGVPKAVVPDCAKAAVSRYCRFDPDINSAYNRLAEHYQMVVLPARPQHPDDKALVEGAVKIVYHWIYASLRNQRFYSIQELNNAILTQLKAYNDKKMQKTKIARSELFLQTEKALLGQLPLMRYEPKKSRCATIQNNYHVYLSEDKHYYSVPYGYYTKSRKTLKKDKAQMLYTQETVEIYFNNERIAVHQRQKTPGYTTNPQHMPENHLRYLERCNPEKIIAQAKSKGEFTAVLVEKILEKHTHPEQAYKRCTGLIYLSNTYGIHRLNQACQKALYFHQYSYKAVKEMLVHNREDFTPEPDLFNTLPEHGNIRGPEYYKTKGGYTA
jgi:transposase